MTKPLIDLPSNSPSPLNVHINRNGFKESLHEVDVVLCDADGSVILGMGDVESVIFPRSAMKPLQSIALIELLNTMENVPEFSDAEVALICASHNGEALHTDAVQGLLSKFDISIDELKGYARALQQSLCSLRAKEEHVAQSMRLMAKL